MKEIFDSFMMQEIIVGAVGILIAAIVLGKIYRFFSTPKGRSDACGCGGCHCNANKKR
ncbi:hypothetical protein M2132_000867 [Dysgonomonas sp. PH5-45]|uniref:FeoB-associated Cys-rich membrane protein n=1 Tax=unclassified Dysgonomonas TaxID=2630389 RepID=UPI002474A53F|nr:MULTISPECIES: FeoB-associated Cys-rich membrane protein [unclassified Dysgonomonas]MDH6354539.1 hypothetical protein [Dysgonomonas sp. PH5-45]MDH6387405.1 hypothetical protein [Dysgonomonas sp. PH5-37]